MSEQRKPVIPEPRPAMPASNHHWTIPLILFEFFALAVFIWWMSRKGLV